MPTFVTMEKQFEGEDAPRQTRVVKSAFEKVWSREGWALPADPAENVVGNASDDEDAVDTGADTAGTPVQQAPSLALGRHAPPLNPPAPE